MGAVDMAAAEMGGAACTAEASQVMMPFMYVHQDGIDRMAIRMYTYALHEKDQARATFAIWADRPFSGHEQVWKQKGMLFEDILAHIRKISDFARADRYISTNSFCARMRRMETLFTLNALVFDMDVHGQENAIIDATVNDVLGKLNECIERGELPIPSMTIMSGRGMQILYLLDPLPRQGLPLWRLIGDAIAKRIRGCIGEDVQSLACLDGNYSDAMHVFRLPGTYNVAAKRYAQIVHPRIIDDVTRYRLDEMRDAFFTELQFAKKKRAKRGVKGDAKVSYLFNAYTLHMARRDDLITLVEMRQGTDIQLDGRKCMIFLYRYWSCFCVGEEAALEAALAFNARFLEPLSPKLVESKTKSAEVAFERWREDKARGYNYKNETLIRLLKITPEEQRRLKTIIGPDEKNRRRAARNWDHDRRSVQRASNRDERMEEKASRDEQIIRMVKDERAYRDIAAQVGVSVGTVAGVVKRYSLQERE